MCLHLHGTAAADTSSTKCGQTSSTNHRSKHQIHFCITIGRSRRTPSPSLFVRGFNPKWNSDQYGGQMLTLFACSTQSSNFCCKYWKQTLGNHKWAYTHLSFIFSTFETSSWLKATDWNLQLIGPIRFSTELVTIRAGWLCRVFLNDDALALCSWSSAAPWVVGQLGLVKWIMVMVMDIMIVTKKSLSFSFCPN